MADARRRMPIRHRSPGALRALLVLVLVGGATLLLPVGPANAATFTVTANRITNNAANDDVVTPNGCDSDCTLRDAVIAANAAAGDDTIVFAAAGTVRLGLVVAGAEPNAGSQDLDVSQNLIVQGHASGTTIDAQNFARTTESRIFEIDNLAGTAVNLTLNGVNLVNGKVSSGGGAVLVNGGMTVTTNGARFGANDASGGGGAIYLSSSTAVVNSTAFETNHASEGGAIGTDDFEVLNISNSTFSNNTAGSAGSNGEGGAIQATAGQDTGLLDVSFSTFTGNSAGWDNPTTGGGAIDMGNGMLFVQSSVFNNNGLQGNIVTANGGAIRTSGNTDDVTLINLTVSNNTITQGRGAGLYLEAGGGTITIEASAIHGNEATNGGLGGGIYHTGRIGMTITNSTISDNHAAGAGGGGLHLGAGGAGAPNGTVFLNHVTLNDNGSSAGVHVTSLGVLRVQNTIVAGSSPSPNCLVDAGGSLTSLGFNMEDTNSCGFAMAGDQPSTNPQLSALADNGSMSPQGSAAAGTINGNTHALPAGSPAIDTADPVTCGQGSPPEDQRFITRPQGPGCDIGAYEAASTGGGADDVGITKVGPAAPIGEGDQATFTITVTNNGATPATGVTVTDPVPSGIPVDSATPSTGNCNVNMSTNAVTCMLGTLAAGASETIDIVVDAPTAGVFNNTACVDTTSADGDPSNDCSTDQLVVIGTVRISGGDRITTSIDGSTEVFGDLMADAVVLTRSDLFPDAQAGTPLAIAKNAPMLLSSPASLNPATEEEIIRVLSPGGTVYLLGGEAALSAAVEDRVEELGFVAVRYGGQNRFGTAAIIADEGLGNPSTLLAANGGNFPDAVVAGAAALAAGGDATFAGAGPDVNAAVILTSGGDIPPETQAYLDGPAVDSPEIWAIGGGAAEAFPDAPALVGNDRYETAVAVAEEFFTAPTAVGLATGLDFADALTGGAVIGRDDVGPGPMLLTDPAELPAVVAEYLEATDDSIDNIFIFGGTAAVSQDVEDEADAIVFGP